jgi:tetratricopeptide (TPR) repeat protein
MSRIADRLNDLSKRFEAKVPHEFRFKRKFGSFESKSPKKPNSEKIIAAGLIIVLVVVFSFLGKQLSKVGERKPAVATLDLVTENRKAIQLFNAQKYPEALKTFQAMLDVSQDDPVLLNNMGVVLKRMGEFERADEFLNRAAEIDPKAATTFNNLGMLRAAQGRYVNAFVYMDQAAKISPEYLDPILNMALIYERQGKFGLAGKTYERYLKSPTLGPLRSVLPERIRRLHSLARLGEGQK